MLRNLIICLLMLVQGGMLCAQNGFSVTGEIEGARSGMVRLNYPKPDHYSQDFIGMMDSGRFRIFARVNEPVLVSMFIEGYTDPVPFFLENSEISVKYSLKQPGDITVTGSRCDSVYRRLKYYDTWLHNWIHTYDSAVAFAKFAEDEYEPRHLRNRYNDSLHVFTDTLIRSITHTQTDYVVLWLLYPLINREENLDSVITVVEHLDSNILKSPYAVDMIRDIEARKKLLIGSFAPAFKWPDAEGKKVSLYPTSGRYILLNFWVDNCLSCNRDMDIIRSAFTKYQTRRMEVINVFCGSDTVQWKRTVQQDRTPWKHVREIRTHDPETDSPYRSHTLPDNLFLSNLGTVMFRNLHGDKLRETLEHFFEPEKFQNK